MEPLKTRSVNPCAFRATAFFCAPADKLLENVPSVPVCQSSERAKTESTPAPLKTKAMRHPACISLCGTHTSLSVRLTKRIELTVLFHAGSSVLVGVTGSGAAVEVDNAPANAAIAVNVGSAAALALSSAAFLSLISETGRNI
jgi:hypothetical protein